MPVQTPTDLNARDTRTVLTVIVAVPGIAIGNFDMETVARHALENHAVGVFRIALAILGVPGLFSGCRRANNPLAVERVGFGVVYIVRLDPLAAGNATFDNIPIEGHNTDTVTRPRIFLNHIQIDNHVVIREVLVKAIDLRQERVAGIVSARIETALHQVIVTRIIGRDSAFLGVAVQADIVAIGRIHTMVFACSVRYTHGTCAGPVVEQHDFVVVVAVRARLVTLDVVPVTHMVLNVLGGLHSFASRFVHILDCVVGNGSRLFVCGNTGLRRALEIEAEGRFGVDGGHVIHAKFLGHIAPALECRVAVITEYKVFAVARRNAFDNGFIVLVNSGGVIGTTEHDVTAAGKRNLVIAALVFCNRAGDSCPIARSVGLVVGLVTLLFAGGVVRTASITGNAIFLANERTRFIVTEACHHVAIGIVIEHLTTVAEHQGAFALDFNLVIAEATESNQAALCHVFGIRSKNLVVTFASVNHKLVVGTVLVAIDIDCITALTTIYNSKGLETVFAINRLIDINRIFAYTQIDFAVFHVTEGNVLRKIILGIFMTLIGMCKTNRLGIRSKKFCVNRITLLQSSQRTHSIERIIHIIHEHSVNRLSFIKGCNLLSQFFHSLLIGFTRLIYFFFIITLIQFLIAQHHWRRRKIIHITSTILINGTKNIFYRILTYRN